MDIVIIVLTFASVTLVSFCCVNAIVSARSSMRADPAARYNSVFQSMIGPVFYIGTGIFAGQSYNESAKALKRKLLLAGQPMGFIEGNHFLGALLMLSVLVFLFNLVMMWFIAGFTTIAFVFPLLIAVAVFQLGNTWLTTVIRDREVSMLRGFPYFLDTAVMTMGAGGTFPRAMEVYVAENRAEPLAQEIAVCLGEIEIGKTLIEALSNLDRRVSVPAVNNALKAIIQGENLGTSIQKSLDEQADVLRFTRSQEAERIAEEMKIKMQGPAMMLLFSVLVLILGPAVVEMTQSGFLG